MEREGKLADLAEPEDLTDLIHRTSSCDEQKCHLKFKK